MYICGKGYLISKDNHYKYYFNREVLVSIYVYISNETKIKVKTFLVLCHTILYIHTDSCSPLSSGKIGQFK